MIETLITSKTRVKLLLKFFLNPGTSAYLRGLETEFGESSNAIRIELNRMEKANMLTSATEGNKKLFKVNQGHPLYNEINSIVRKYLGLDVIVEWIADKLGDLEEVYLTGALAKGRNADLIDLVLIGNINKGYLVELVEKAERLISRKIRYIVYHERDKERFLQSDEEKLLLWNRS